MNSKLTSLMSVLLLGLSCPLAAAPVNSAFTYQGVVEVAGQPADGNYDFEFRLFDAPAAGVQAGPTLVQPGVAMTEGLLMTALDFGLAPFQAGQARWLQVGLRPAGSAGAYTILGTRHPLLATPFALYSLSSAGGSGSGNSWSVLGNTGTDPLLNFLGTVDSSPLELRVAGVRALRLEPSGQTPNVIAGSEANAVAGGVVGAAVGGGGASNPEGGQFPNVIMADYGSVVGGTGNTVFDTAPYGVVLGGQDNTSAGPYSVAAGLQARADHANSFIWSDGQGGEFASVADAEFGVRAAGGLRLASPRGVILDPADSPIITRGWDPFSSGPNAGLGRWGLFMENSHLVIGIPSIRDRFFQVAKYASDGTRQALATVDNAGNLSLAGVLTQNSDRAVKTGIRPVDSAEILERIAELPISRWSYRADEDTDHIGPMAQDFHRAFGLGANERGIASIDADGVALAAIQGLHALVREKEEHLASLEQQNRQLEERLARVEALLAPAASALTSGGRE